jgi:hypothetical protein
VELLALIEEAAAHDVARRATLRDLKRRDDTWKLRERILESEMTSELQAEANRQNAKKSTGPRTPAGKAVVALNGMKHGLLSRESLVKGESEADLVAFGKRLRTQLAPVGELELLLVDRVVSTAWRLRRLVAVETTLFNHEVKPDHAFNNYGREKMSVLSRYEVTLERSLYKALHELQRLQATRDGQAVPLPEAVDVEVSVTGPDELDELALIGENTSISSSDHNERD